MKILKHFIHSYAAQKDRIHRLSREGGWIVAGQAASVLGSLVLVRVLTEYLEPAEYGKLALGLTISGLFSGVLFGGIGNGVVRYYSVADERGELSDYFEACKRLILNGVLVTLLIIVIVLLTQIAFGWNQWIGLSLAVAIYGVISTQNSIVNGIQNAARQRAIVAIHSGVDAWLKIAFAFAFIYCLGASGVSAVIGYTLSSTIVIASQFLFLKNIIKARSKYVSGRLHFFERSIWTYGWPFMIWGVFGWLQQSSTRWALEAFATTSEVGRYAVLSQLGYTPIQLATGFLMTLIMPILFSRAGAADNEERRKDVSQLTNLIGIVGIVATLVATSAAWIFHSAIFQALAGENYRSVSMYLPIMVIAGGVFAVAQIYASRLMALMDVRAIMPASVISSLIGVLSAFACTFYFGYEGAVFSILIHAVSYLLLILLVIRVSALRKCIHNKAL